MVQTWLKTAVGGIFIFSVLMQLVPEGRFKKYVRFYAGLVFLLILTRPVLRFFTEDTSFDRLLRTEFLKKDAEDMSASVSVMNTWKEDQIYDTYCTEIRRQLSALAQSYCIPVTALELQFDPDNRYLLTEIRMTVQGSFPMKEQAMSRELTAVYYLPADAIRIMHTEKEPIIQ